MKTPITKTIVASAAAMSLTVAAFAGETVQVSKNPAPPAPELFYNAHEFQLGISALYGRRSNTSSTNVLPFQGAGLNAQAPVLGAALQSDETKGAWGADVELAYFITRNFGISLEQQWFDFGRPLWNTSANAIFRFPLGGGTSRWAPYIFAGLGDVYAGGQGRFELHGGGGFEYRFTPKFGTFIDGRYTWVNGDNDNLPQYGAFRAGLRFVF